MVSVIIPNYNHAKYLDQRIQSVLNQTYQNFEVIILDDKSSDNGASKAVIEKYRGNPHISHIVYNEVNSGSTFKQWEKGFELAKGEYIWIAESDDFCEPIFLDRMMFFVKRDSNCVFAYSPVVWVDSDGIPYRVPTKARSKNIHGSLFLKEYMLWGNHVLNASCAVFKKDVLQSIGRRFMHMKGAGDYMFWVELALHGSVTIVNEKLCYWRRHIGVVTSKCDLSGINLIEEKQVIDFLVSKVEGINKRMLSICYEERLRRIYSNTFENEEIRLKLYNLWKTSECPPVNVDKNSLDYLSYDLTWVIRRNDYAINTYPSELFIGDSLYKLRCLSRKHYYYFLLLELYKKGFCTTYKDYKYVCMMRCVHVSPIKRILSMLIVMLGGYKRKIQLFH